MKTPQAIMALLPILLFTGQAHGAEHRLGGGAQYWKAMDDIDIRDIDEDGFSYLVSYQYRPTGYLAIEMDLEVLPDKYGETAYAPQAFLLVGNGLYAGAGIGIEYCDSDFADDPFFILRAGVNLELLPRLYADIYAHYRFNNFSDFDDQATDPESDTIFVGSALRFAF